MPEEPSHRAGHSGREFSLKLAKRLWASGPGAIQNQGTVNAWANSYLASQMFQTGEKGEQVSA